MNQRFDLSSILREWPEVPGSMTVRLLRLDDGRVVLQRRVALGVFQMETTGRPDGLRPAGHESVLADFRTRGRLDADRLPDHEIDAAEREAALYLHRAVAMAALGEIEAVIRDSEHVRSLAMIGNGASGELRSAALARLSVQAILLAVRAEVVGALREPGSGSAVEAIDRGLAALEAALARSGSISPIDSSWSDALRSLRAALVPKLPASQREELRERLEAAIRTENFELAAILRNELRQMLP